MSTPPQTLPDESPSQMSSNDLAFSQQHNEPLRTRSSEQTLFEEKPDKQITPEREQLSSKKQPEPSSPAPAHESPPLEHPGFRTSIPSNQTNHTDKDNDHPFSPLNSNAMWNRASCDGDYAPTIRPPLIKPQKKNHHAGLRALLASSKKEDLGAPLKRRFEAAEMNAEGGPRKLRCGGGMAREVGVVKGGGDVVLDELDDAAAKTEGVIKDLSKDISKEQINKNTRLDDNNDSKRATEENDVKQDVVESEESLELDDLFDDGSNDLYREDSEKSVAKK